MRLGKRFLVVSSLVLACGVARAEKLSLDDAIRTALEHNQTVKVVDYGRKIARANVTAAWGTFDPTINFHDKFADSGAPSPDFPLGTQLDIKSRDIGLSLDGTMPWGLSYSIGANQGRLSGDPGMVRPLLFNSGDSVTITEPLLRNFGFGANLYNIRVAKADRAISDANYKQELIDLVTNVIISYNNLIQAREGRRIAILYRDGVATLSSDNEKRFQAGQLAEADVIQARASAASAEEQVITASRAVSDSENQLRRLLGATQFQIDGPEMELAPLPDDINVTADPAADIKAALLRRPDYESSRQGLYKLRAARSLANNQLLPQVDLVASAGYNGLDTTYRSTWEQVREDQNRSRSIGVVVSVPLTFTQSRGKARAARLGVRQGEEDLHRLEADISLEITTDAAQLETTKARVESLKNAYTLTDQTLQAEIKRLKAGAGSTFIVLTKQQDLAGIEFRRIAAISDQRRAIATYQRAIGTTLEVNHVSLAPE
ncbi:MAG TPA: TolC family protein [Opitutaceae bacterium]